VSSRNALPSEDKVSVLISTYNRADYLAKAIESALEQSYGNLEIIVANDGSTDETAQVCARYTDKIKYVHHKNSGLGPARQLALANATGNYLAWLDDDDVWLPDKVERMIRYLEEHPEYGWAHGDAIEVDSDGAIEHESYLAKFGSLKMQGDVYKEMLSVCFPLTSTVVMRKSCLEKLGKFDTSENYGADVDFFLRCSLYYDIGLVPEKLVKRTLHAADYARANNVYDLYSFVSCRIPIFEKILSNNADLSAEQRKATVSMQRQYQYRLGEIYWGNYDLKASRQLFMQSLEWNLRSIRALIYMLLCMLPPSAIRFLRHVRRGGTSS